MQILCRPENKSNLSKNQKHTDLPQIKHFVSQGKTETSWGWIMKGKLHRETETDKGEVGLEPDLECEPLFGAKRGIVSKNFLWTGSIQCEHI